MTTNLKPCPFCGHTEIKLKQKKSYGDPITVCAFCPACLAWGPWQTNMAQKHQAVTAWNTRPAPNREGWLTRDEIENVRKFFMCLEQVDYYKLNNLCDMALAALGHE